MEYNTRQRYRRTLTPTRAALLDLLALPVLPNQGYTQESKTPININYSYLN